MSAALDIVRTSNVGVRNKNVELLKDVIKEWGEYETEVRNAGFTPIRQVKRKMEK